MFYICIARDGSLGNESGYIGRQGGGGVWLNPWHLTLKFENSLGGDAKMPARLALLAAR